LLNKLSNSADQLSNCEALLKIPIENIIEQDALKKSIIKTKVWSSYDVNFKLNKYNNICEDRLNMIHYGLINSTSLSSILSSLKSSIAASLLSTHPADSAIRTLSQVNRRLYDLAVQEGAQFEEVQTEYLVADLCHFFAKNTDDKFIAESLDQLIEADKTFNNISTYISNNDRQYYFKLNQLYFSGAFDLPKTKSSLQADLDEFLISSDKLSIEDRACVKMEYFTYYAQRQILYHGNSYDKQVIREILIEAESLGHNPSLPTYNYIERVIIALLDQHTYRNEFSVDLIKPSISIFNSANQLELNKPDINIEGFVVDNIGIAAFSINNEPVIPEENGHFNHTISLQEGPNLIVIDAKDAAGNSTQVSTHITYSPPSDPFLTRTNLAVLFAVEDYIHDDVWNDLRNPIHDATALAKELFGYGFDTILIRNPTRSQFNLEIRRLLERKYGPYDQLFVFFSGHGHEEVLQKQGFLVMKDSQDPSQEASPGDSYCSIDDLGTKLNRSQCRHILLVLDACHSGLIDESIAMKNIAKLQDLDFAKAKLALKSRKFITSVGNVESSDGKAGQHSPFIRGILSVFRSGNKLITFEELCSDVQQTVTSFHQGAKNIESSDLPHFGSFGNEEPGATFVFIKK
jgi:hypothetical protein